MVAVGADGEVKGKAAGRVLARRCEVGVVDAGYLEVERGRFGHPSGDAVLEVALHLLGGTEEGHVPTEGRIVQLRVRLDVLGEAVESEMDLEVRSPVIDGPDALDEGLWKVPRLEQAEERATGVKVRHDVRRADLLAVGELDASDPALGDEDLGDLGVAAERAAVSFEEPQDVL